MLLFITARHNIYEQPHIISIHLMLLFINLNRWENNVFDYFNTSHVTVYLDAGTSNSVPCVISIHLMLLFIWMICSPEFMATYFNTSHVTVYPAYNVVQINQTSISIHLMLLFINVFILCYSGFCKFQYISCYCLSLYISKPHCL